MNEQNKQYSCFFPVMYCPNYYFGQTYETLLSIKLNGLIHIELRKFCRWKGVKHSISMVSS